MEHIYSKSSLSRWISKKTIYEKVASRKVTLHTHGRISESYYFEDIILQYVKDLRREEHCVTRSMIIVFVSNFLPEFTEGKTYNAMTKWCSRFEKRNNLSIRRITHSGREKQVELGDKKEEFVNEVTKYVSEHLLDPKNYFLPEKCHVWNMDQTSIYASNIPSTTLELTGKKVVASVTGKIFYLQYNLIYIVGYSNK